MAGININRTTSGVLLPAEVSSEIWAETLEESAVMRLARRIDMPGAGVTIQTITGEPEAAWVDETAEKPVSRHTFGSKSITPYKLAVIEPFSMEFARDKARLYAELARRLPNALARKFDETIFHGTAPGSNFDVLSDCEALGLNSEEAYDRIVAIDAAIAEGNGQLDGWALSPKARSVLLGAKDGDGRPLLVDSIVRDRQTPSLLGAPVSYQKAVYKAEDSGEGTPEVLGFAGDWTSAMYGVVEGVSVSVSTEATLTDGQTTLNLWQRNMFAIRAEIEVAFAVRNKDHFVKVVAEAAEAE